MDWLLTTRQGAGPACKVGCFKSHSFRISRASSSAYWTAQGMNLQKMDDILAQAQCRVLTEQRGRPHQVVGKEARALGSIKQELADRPAVVSSQLLHQLRQEECHLRTQSS